MQIDNGRFYKVRPIFNLYISNIKTRDVAVDEHIIKYHGRHGVKHFIYESKPIGYGFEAFGIAGSNDFLYHIDPSCGSSTKLPDYGLGHGPNIVLGLIDKIEPKKGTKIYFDNRFTTISLVKELCRRQLNGTRTMRKKAV